MTRNTASVIKSTWNLCTMMMSVLLALQSISLSIMSSMYIHRARIFIQHCSQWIRFRPLESIMTSSGSWTMRHQMIRSWKWLQSFPIRQMKIWMMVQMNIHRNFLTAVCRITMTCMAQRLRLIHLMHTEKILQRDWNRRIYRRLIFSWWSICSWPDSMQSRSIRCIWTRILSGTHLYRHIAVQTV